MNTIMRCKRSGFLAVLIAAGILLSQVLVWAEPIEGTVSLLDLSTQSMSIRPDNPKSGELNPIYVTSGPKTEFKGIAALAELQVGDKVKVDASKNEVSGQLEAQIVEKR